MAKLSDVNNRAIRELLGNYTNTRSAIVGGTQVGVNTAQSPAAHFQPTINGVTGALKADLANEALVALPALQNPITGLDTFYVQPGSTTAGGTGAATTVYYLFVMNLAGTIYCIQGNYTGRVIPGRVGRWGIGISEMPDIVVPALYAPFGAMKVVTGTDAFTVGTTNTDATTGSMVITFASLSMLGESLPTFA